VQERERLGVVEVEAFLEDFLEWSGASSRGERREGGSEEEEGRGEGREERRERISV